MRPVDRGMAGPGLLAHVITAKYADHVPLYRQSAIYARDGVEIDRSTMAITVWPCSCATKMRQLLTRLDQAIGKAIEEEIFTDEIIQLNSNTFTDFQDSLL